MTAPLCKEFRICRDKRDVCTEEVRPYQDTEKKSGYLTMKLKESKEVYGKVFEDGKGRQNDIIMLKSQKM